MNVFIYSDESGVFDKKHNDFFVFGGVIFLSKSEKDKQERKYLHAERVIRERMQFSDDREVKAVSITNTDKSKLFRSLNGVYKFGVVIRQRRVLNEIFASKKSKQRYLDFAYKIAVKKAFNDLINKSVINPLDVKNLYFFVDEHTTATDGRYELKESLEQEFKIGTFNMVYDRYFKPIFPALETLSLEYCNSESKTLVRAADIVSNKLYYCARAFKMKELLDRKDFHIIFLPS